MIPTTQTILHDPANGMIGNCLSAVLASLLHLPIELVPTFNHHPGWTKDVNEWLRPYGLAYLSITKASFDQAFADAGVKECHHEIAGPSRGFDDVHHACVAVDGKLVFDPHLNGDGLEEYDTCGVFIALEPWRMLA